MSWLLDLTVVGVAAGLLVYGGRAALRALGSRQNGEPVIALSTGLVALHLGISVLDLLGLPWTLATVVAPLALLALWGRRVGGGADRRWLDDPGVGDLLAVCCVLTVAALALATWTAHPDFVFHWGNKGQRFFLHQGIDYGFFSRPWAALFYPDYPNLLPEIFVLTSMLRGSFSVPAALTWSAVLMAAMLLAARDVWRPIRFRQSAVALGALTLTVPAIALQMAGNADWLMALALAVSMAALTGEAPDRDDDLRIGLAAALAAASKFEGLFVGPLLIAVYLGRRWWRTRPLRRSTAVLVGLPWILVVIPWAVQLQRHALLADSRTHGLDASRFPDLLSAMTEALRLAEWHGMAPWLLLGLAVLVLRRSPQRWLALASLSILGSYSAVYLLSQRPIRFWVLSSFPRLLFHLALPILVMALAELDRWSAGRAYPAPEPAPEGKCDDGRGGV